MQRTVFKCDRCGREYTTDAWPEVILGGDVNVTVQMKAIIQSDITMNYEDIDLCKYCRDEFKVWFEKKATEGVP